MVNIPRSDRHPAPAVPYRDITSHVRTALTRNFRNFELLVTLGQAALGTDLVVGTL